MTGARNVLRVIGAPARVLAIVLIHVYRVTLGGLLAGHCRFYPSCSQYAEAAVKSRGALEGMAFAIWRVLRCGPFTPGGVDHPPAPRRAKSQPVNEPAYEGVIQPRGDR
jgi:putative membrane protein insertion efficiency factor